LILDGLQLAAIYDPNRLNAEATRDHYLKLLAESAQSTNRPVENAQVNICSSPEELIEQVDLIDICSPARYHAIYAAMALEHNVHAMTEKPMARTWWEARVVEKAAQKSEAFFQLNDDNVFLPRYRTLRNVIDHGMIGEVQQIWIARGSHGPEGKEWFWNPIENGGGCIMDYGSHAVNSIWFLVGYDKVPTEIRSLGIECRQPMRLIGGRFRMLETDDDAHFKILFVNPKNGDWITVVIEATWSWPELGPESSDVRGYIEIEGSKGTVTGFVDENDRDFLRVRSRGFGERLIPVQSTLSESGSFQDEINNFIMAIRASVPSMLNASVGAGIINMLNCAQLSELRGRVSITPRELEAFSRETAGKALDAWQAGDQIISTLYAPFSTVKKS
jgi:predicted dehydrogenase